MRVRGEAGLREEDGSSRSKNKDEESENHAVGAVETLRPTRARHRRRARARYGRGPAGRRCIQMRQNSRISDILDLFLAPSIVPLTDGMRVQVKEHAVN